MLRTTGLDETMEKLEYCVKEFGFYLLKGVCVCVCVYVCVHMRVWLCLCVYVCLCFVFNLLTSVTLHNKKFKNYREYVIKASLPVYSIHQPSHSPP